MLNVGLLEFVVVAVVSLFVLEKDQIKELLRLWRFFSKKIKDLKQIFLVYLTTLEETRDIKGDNGKVYTAYKLKVPSTKDNDSTHTDS